MNSSGSASQCFGQKDIKDEGRCCEGGSVDGRQQQQQQQQREAAEIAEKWGTLDKMKNGMEDG